MRSTAILLVWTCCVTYCAQAQFVAGPLTINGSVGFSANGYAASGIEGRRAPMSAETFAAARFNLWGLTTGVNLTYSTDQSQLRQSVNRLAFDTEWDWGELAAGDVAPAFSEYSLNGTTLRGGMVEIRPGNFDLALTAGRARRAIEFRPQAGLRGAAFRRMLYGARLGYGDESGTHLHLNGTYSRDHASSVLNPGDESPHENFTLTPEAGLSLLNGRVLLNGQLTTSALTKDVRAPRADADLPWYTFIRPRAGTRLNYAGKAGMQVGFSSVDFNAEYRRIQPGFEALGLARVRSDEEIFRLQPTFRFFSDRLTIGANFARSRNNLLGDMISTMYRRQWGGLVQARISQSLAVHGTYSRLVNENDAASKTAIHQRNVSQVVMITPVLSLQQVGGTSHSVSFSGSWQQFADESAAVLDGRRPGERSQNLTSTLTYSLRLPSGLSLNATGNLLSQEARTVETHVAGLNAGAGYSFFDRAVMLNVNGGWSRTDITVLSGTTPVRSLSSQLTSNVNASYRLPNGDTLRLRIRSLVNSSEDDRRDFREVRTSLRFDHRF